MATWEQRRRGIMRTALEMERDLFSAENRYIAELRTGMTDMQLELQAKLGRINAQPRADGQFDWEKSQTESLIAELNYQIDQWSPKAVSTVQAGTADANERGSEYPKQILDAGGSTVRAQPRLGGNQLAMFHAYDAGLVRGVSERTRAELTGLIRRAALGGDSVFSLMNSIGTVAGKGAFATAFHRGEAIVRTEMGRAYSSASMATMNQTALDHPGLQKKWLSIIDGRVRPEHAAAHDQVRPLNQPFSVGGERLMHPHDTTGSAWNTINCRCKAVPWDPAWDKLPPPGVEAKLGPLTVADKQGFQQRLAELDRLGAKSQAHTWADQVFAGRGRSKSKADQDAAWASMDEDTRYAGWPTPMNPSYWRTKTGFTLDELKLLGGPTYLAAFLRERYGIALVHDPFDMDHDFNVAMGWRMLQALELYRSLDPSLVVENDRLRWIGTQIGMNPNVLGEASLFGDIKINSEVLHATMTSGRTRDPAGVRAPRLSDDVALEVFLHEIGHAISYRYGIPFEGIGAYISSAALPSSAWFEWSVIHNTSSQMARYQANLTTTRARIAELDRILAATDEIGYGDLDPATQTLRAERLKLRESAGHLVQQIDLASKNTTGGLYPSDYAESSIHEDFSESLALARLQPAEFKTSYAPRYAWFSKWLPRLIE